MIDNNSNLPIWIFGFGIFAIIFIVAAFSSDVKYCNKQNCNNTVEQDEFYCYKHKPKKNTVTNYNKSTTSTSKSTGASSSKSIGATTSKSSSSSTSKSKSSGSSYKSSSSKKKYYQDSYDDGYEDIYDNEDYDFERYKRDSDYANGVDDAMEDAWEDFGDEW